MLVLNEFLKIVCSRADDNEDLNTILRDFLEPDTNDKKIHGGAVVRTIETIVNPFKSGMRTIKNMPDNLVGGVTKLLLGKGPTNKETTSFLDVTPVHLEVLFQCFFQEFHDSNVFSVFYCFYRTHPNILL